MGNHNVGGGLLELSCFLFRTKAYSQSGGLLGITLQTLWYVQQRSMLDQRICLQIWTDLIILVSHVNAGSPSLDDGAYMVPHL